MSFHHRRRHFRLRFPEILGFALLAAFCISSLFAYRQFGQQAWVKTTASVRAVNLPEKYRVLDSPISSTQNGVAVLYDYHAGGRTYTGSWESNWLSTPMVYRTTPELISVLEGVESISVKRLPEQAENDLALEIESNISEPRKEALKSMRGEDYYNVNTVRRKSLAGILPEGTDMPYLQDQQNPAIQIRYNPSRPSESRLNYPGFNMRMPAMIAFFLSLAATLFYFVRGYPELKMRGM